MTRANHPRPVLIIDDDPDIREIISQVLADHDFPVLLAENGLQALATLRANGDVPCLILLDLMMPVMNGWEFLAERRNDPALEGVPVVVMTAMLEARLEALEVSAHLKKPISYDQLVSVVTRFAAA